MYNPQITVERIRKERKNNNITSVELNCSCGLNKNTIATSANSKMGLSAKILYDIADCLNCSVDYLLGRTDEAGSPTPSDRQIRQLDLSGNELTIVKLFEKLSETQQGELIGRAKLMAEQNDENYMQDGTA